MRLDLHLHSTASDGVCTPVQVVREAEEGGLHVIALTDHDSVDGYAEAVEAAEGRDIQVIPGLEMSSTLDGRDVHVLGYFVDPDSGAVQGHASRAGTRRETRMAEMVERLKGQGIDISMADVEAFAGPKTKLGRPHLAQALVQAGHAESVPAAFDSLIGDRHSAFVPTDMQDPSQAIRVILESGGIPVWAHPPEDLLERHLPTFVSAGLRGLEVFRPRWSPSYSGYVAGKARAHQLLVSGGSDWHGPDSGTLGDFHVTSDEVGRLLEEGGL